MPSLAEEESKSHILEEKKLMKKKIYWKVRDYDYFIEKSGATGLIRSLKAQNIFL